MMEARVRTLLQGRHEVSMPWHQAAEVHVHGCMRFLLAVTCLRYGKHSEWVGTAMVCTSTLSLFPVLLATFTPQLQVTHVPVSPELMQAVLAVSHASIPEQVLSANVAGFILVGARLYGMQGIRAVRVRKAAEPIVCNLCHALPSEAPMYMT
jgi:hypothetical protein